MAQLQAERPVQGETQTQDDDQFGPLLINRLEVSVIELEFC